MQKVEQFVENSYFYFELLLYENMKFEDNRLQKYKFIDLGFFQTKKSRDIKIIVDSRKNIGSKETEFYGVLKFI